jgi:uncharacterized protein involved in exopolysaccharide biosynthesis
MQDVDDEISILDLLIVLRKHKKMIISLFLLAGIASAVYAFTSPKIYRSECTIELSQPEKSSLANRLSAFGELGSLVASQVSIGGANSIEQLEIVLKSRELSYKIIQDHHLMPLIFPDEWDKKKQQWKEKTPLYQDAFEAVKRMLTVMPNRKANTINMAVEYPDPVIARDILNYYIQGLSERLRIQEIEDAAAQRNHLKKELYQTSDPILKARLADIIAQQTEKEALARIQKYYGFDIVDSPFVPEKKYKPKRAMIILLSLISALFIGVFLSFILEYIRNLKAAAKEEDLDSTAVIEIPEKSLKKNESEIS